MIKTAFYARYSSSAQRAESIEGQRRICAQYAQQHDLSIVCEYTDEAMTGKNDKRPAFQRMIKDAERGRFDALVVYSVDRFARNLYDSAIYEHRLETAGVVIHYATQAFGDSPESVILYATMKGYAEYYSKNLAIQVKRGMTENALKCRWNGAVPLGYRKRPDMMLEPDPVTAPYVRFVFENYAAGVPLTDIVRRLNADGAHGSSGKPFTKASFQNTLHNPVYIGTYHWGDVTIDNVIPPLIDNDIFERVQKMTERYKKTPARAKAKEIYILSGKLFCGICGAPMIGESGKSHTGTVHYYYTCAAHKKPAAAGQPKCPKRPERKADIETAVIRYIRNLLTDETINNVSADAAALLKKKAADADRVPALIAQLKQVEQRINNIMDAIEQGIFTPTTKQRLTDLETQRDDIQAQIDKEANPLPVLTQPEIAYWLTRLRSGDMSAPDYQLTLIDTLLNSAAITDSEDKKIALAVNLTASGSQTLTGSDLMELVHLHIQNPNQKAYLINDYVIGYVFSLEKEMGAASQQSPDNRR